MIRIALVFLLLAGPALAATSPAEMLPDAPLEARARMLGKELRCLVCQNQSIDDSDAPLARDLRLLVRERLKAGDGDSQVLGFLTSRYGEFVLLKPRLSPATALLWLFPAVLVVIGAGTLAAIIRRRAALPGEAALTPDEEARLAELVGAPKE